MRRLFALLLLPSLLGAVSARAEIIERIIAKVNGEIITLSDFQERQLTAAQIAHVDPSQIGPFLRQHNAQILQDAIDEILILQRAQDEGLALRPEFVDEVIDSIKKDNKITSEEQFQAALDSEGLTLPELRENIKKSWTRKMVLQRDIEPKLNVDEDEIRAEYEARKAEDYTKPATVTLAEILVADEAGGASLARQIVAKARDGGDFAELARQYSSSPTAESGGVLGEISQGDLAPALEKVAFSLAVGAISDPIPVEGGVRILKVVAKTSGSVVPYETARAKIKDRLMMKQFEKEYDKYMEEVRSKAVVELRVREVPLTLSGPIPPETLLEGVDPFSLGPTSTMPGPAPTAPSPAGAGDEISVTPQARPEHVTPPGLPGVGDDEISTTPQAAPERVAPPAAPAPDEKTPLSR
jgi:peptidyl-prolyl cis-trans isomerase SurA